MSSSSPLDRPARVRLRPRGRKRFQTGHPWIYRDDVEVLEGGGDCALARVERADGVVLAYGAWSPRSKIAVRRLLATQGAPDAACFATWARRAAELRGRVIPADVDAFRLAFGESDGLPGFIADLYGRHLVVQRATAAAEAFTEPILEGFRQAGVRVDSVLARDDAGARAIEGLAKQVSQLRGRTPDRVVVREGRVRYAVDLRRGQKTGAFLDQRRNRMTFGRLARGRVLDAFCHEGGFGLHAAGAAEEVVAVDGSAQALDRARENAAMLGVDNLSLVRANVFDDLRDRASRREAFDAISLDPPAFAKSRRDVPGAERGYREINSRAMRLLRPGGILMTASCSYHMSASRFRLLVGRAATDAGKVARLIEERTQDLDHPIRLDFPESAYLKCLVLEMT